MHGENNQQFPSLEYLLYISFQLLIAKHPRILEIMEMSPMWKPHMEVPQLILAYQIAMN